MVVIHSAAEIAAMRTAGQLVAQTFAHMMPLIVPGVSTLALDTAAETFIRAHGATPAYKGYLGFPATICVAPNSVICHGIPSASDILRDGDILGLDIGVIVNGWYGDACITVPVGKISAEAQTLLDVTAECLRRGIAAATVGNTLGDIGAAVQAVVEAAGFSVVREYVGHGIGRAMHEAPEVPNYGVAGKGGKLKKGMTLAVEPMVTIGEPDTFLSEDGWTVLSADRSWAAHFEHTIAIGPNGPEILTRP